MTTSTVLGLPYLSQQQASPEISHNTALYLIEAMLRGVKAQQNAPPGAPADGDTYIVGTAGSGAWLGKNNLVAIYASNAWRFVPGFNTAGAQIAIGAAHEGMQLYNQATDALMRWSGAAWVSIGAGPFVQIAGDTMTGVLTVNVDTQFPLVIQRTNNGAVGPYFRLFQETASPAAGDYPGGFQTYGRDSAANSQLWQSYDVQITDPTSGSEDSQVEIYTRVAGASAARITIGNGVLFGAAAGGLQGVGTTNAINYFDDGVNINTIYAGLAAANVFTAAQAITLAAPSLATPGGANQLLESTDAGAAGAYLSLYHNSASPAANDRTRVLFWNKNSAATPFIASSFQSRLDDATAGSEDSTMEFLTVVAGVFNTCFSAAQGLFLRGAGGDMGVGAFNGSSYYANGNLSIDTNALLRPRAFTVGTLPTASGVTGALARVSDSLAAPVYNAAAVGGGTTNAQVMSDGTIWRYC